MIPTPTQHPLPRDGTSQAARVPSALDPNQRLLDDRQLDDLLLFVRQLAERLTYYNLDNKAEGTWEPFLARQVAVQLAELAHRTSDALRFRLNALGTGMGTGTEAERLAAAREMLGVLAREMGRVDAWSRTFARTSFLAAVERVISQTLRAPLLAVISAIRAVVGGDAIDWIRALSEKLTSDLWSFRPGDIAADATLAAAPREDQLAGLGSRLETLGRAVLDALAQLAFDAEQFLNAGSLATGEQPPYLGLLLAWLTLFRHGQTALNDLVRRHLEFYFRAILQVRPRESAMDQLFVTFEPAKNVEITKVAAGTRLFAGKDAIGAEMQFALTRDLLVHQALVAELRSTFLDHAVRDAIRAAPVANSADGLGGELTKEHPAWRPFGHPALLFGRRGFALAAPVLHLTGGEKTIQLKLKLTAAAGTLLDQRCAEAATRGGPPQERGTWPLDGLFAVALTGPKGWLSLDPGRVRVRFGPSAELLELVLGPIPPEEAVVPYDAVLHGRAFQTSQPVLEFTLHEPLAAYPGGFFDGLQLAEAAIACDVSGDANLVIATDLGTADPSKPFQPFGPAPTAASSGTTGSSFYVGSPEIFAKHLTRLDLNIEWKDKPANPATYFSAYLSDTIAFRVKPAFLSRTRWAELGTGDLDLFASPLRIPDTEILKFDAAPEMPAFTTLEPGLVRGFVRLLLSSPSFAFGHQKFPELYTKAIVSAVNKKTDPSLPNPPFSPSIASITASYIAEASRRLDQAGDSSATLEFHHVEPHGEWPVAGEAVELLPAPSGDGIFFIGLSDFARGQVALLFHLADGSGDPFKAYPALEWQYLAGDAWQTLKPAEILADGTKLLRRTGIIVFDVPGEATTVHSRMPARRVWLRAVATGEVAALNQAYAVTTQAGEAVFVDNGNDLTRLGIPLPSASVKRLVAALPTIKKVVQPLPSFGGVPVESGQRYYRRVSERVRHRRRAVALWDYERLVLEQFPELHKVKCVPHTSPESELAPGHVMLVLVPRLAVDAFDPRRPAASQDLLTEVKKFIGPLASEHVSVHIENPLYEEVQVLTKLTFRPGYDEGFYLRQTVMDLTQFLTPWVSGGEESLAFERELYPSAILNFLEEREYIDFVSEFRARQFVKEAPISPDPLVLVPTTERSILVSHVTHDVQCA
jgi:hypothetical protein